MILKKNWFKIAVLLILFAAGFFLRIYNIDKTLTFLGDQGRDAIIIKRLLKLENLPAIGPPSSIGQIYLGPFYYYLVAPFLLIFNYNPVGLGIGVGLYSLLLTFLIFVISKKILKEWQSFALLIFLLFSPTLVSFSRFSWNPNLVPYFSLLTTLFFFLGLKERSVKKLSISAFFYALALQLHYSLLFLLPIYLFFLIKFLGENKKDLNPFKTIGFISLSFIFPFTPLILFELKHSFLNLKNFFKLLESTGGGGIELNYIIEIAGKITKIALNISLSQIVGSIILFLLIFSGLLIEKDLFKRLLSLQILLTLFFSFFLKLRPIPHYFGLILPNTFLLLIFSLDKLIKKTFIKVLFILAFILIWIPQYELWNPPKEGQVEKARRLAHLIEPYISKDKKTQIIGVPLYESTTPVRYFLELKGITVMEENSLETPEELFVFCVESCENILGNPQWHIAVLKNKKIDKIWKIDKNLTIYKIINNEK